MAFSGNGRKILVTGNCSKLARPTVQYSHMDRQKSPSVTLFSVLLCHGDRATAVCIVNVAKACLALQSNIWKENQGKMKGKRPDGSIRSGFIHF